MALSGLAPVAQLDRAGGFYPSGCGFDSCRGRRFLHCQGRSRGRDTPLGASCPILTPSNPPESLFFGRVPAPSRTDARSLCRSAWGPDGPARWLAPGLVAASIAALPSAPAFAGPPPSHAAGWARPAVVVNPSDWTKTWSTGPLPDAGQPIALSSPIVADLDGQPSVVVGDRRGFVYAYHLASSSPTGHRGGRMADHR